MIKTSNKIINACEEMAIVEGRGFYNLTMEELAARAGINKRTLYRYFDSKEDIFSTTIEKIMDGIVAKNVEIFSTNSDIVEIAGKLFKNVAYIANQQVLKDLETYYPMLWKKIEDFRLDKIELFINMLINNSKIKMKWRVNPIIAKAVFTASIIAVINPHFILENEMTFEEAGRDLLNMFFFGAVEQTE
ncbi:MAG: helix-turn-helix domain-containing protein [Eubacteriales bacterium]